MSAKAIIHTSSPRSSSSSTSSYASEASYDHPYYSGQNEDFPQRSYQSDYYYMSGRTTPRSGPVTSLVRTPEARLGNPDGYYVTRRDANGREVIVHNYGQAKQGDDEPRYTKDKNLDKRR